MSRPRPTPFDLVFEPVAQTTFASIRMALDQAGQDPHDRDAFLILREVVTFLRDLRPEEGLGEGIDQLAALVHHAYLFWNAGGPTVDLTSEQLPELLGATPPGTDDHRDQPSYYVLLPERRIWAHVIPGQPPEPLDGCFVYLQPDQEVLRVLGVFGVHPERQGFSVVEVIGRRPEALARADGSGLFSPILPGGAAAGLFSLAGEEELLELGWRTRGMAAAASVGESRWRA
jgi:hypothetical protein